MFKKNIQQSSGYSSFVLFIYHKSYSWNTSTTNDNSFYDYFDITSLCMYVQKRHF